MISFFMPATLWHTIKNMYKLNIVMTGGTSGFGAATSTDLINTLGTNVILGNRNSQIKGAKHIPLNLESLDNVRQFASEVVKNIRDEKIQVLICNAGMNHPDINSRTVDGFETTFAVNHLAHFYLLRLLIPYLDANAKIIMTTSGTHDPEENALSAPPKHANAIWLAYPEQDKTLDEKMAINAQRAYSSSKLCTILTVRYLAATAMADQNNWQCIAYDPGATPGTGLLQKGTLVMRLAWQVFTIPFLRKRILPKSNSIKDAGITLAHLVWGKVKVPADKVYVALRAGKITFPSPSTLAQNNMLMKDLWEQSEQLLNDAKFKLV
ncbi:NAD(P)-dependent dehydrogenase (short-subunit alcohol dehydrogenase family) [Algoriphagus sp. 4150]|uniref:SDR family NAD(P)-dependent oxidoreductase n=1 Tax=Algoriphagus sp. 4150 TaxID=2817756 RepID=UPI002865B670|nr:SDR family NAD(P)-dependent oxidoreductase [Algoriphagus sp. 4150]MDR7131838.1 NAD(P)-dependent dehydrogenase (short-subunit alcohol dehydrogenase family) [Algoriphagus sp. 4150]